MLRENGSWEYGVKGVPNIPYGLPKLIEDCSDSGVFIFEGEKDFEPAWEHGLLTATNVGDSGSN